MKVRSIFISDVHLGTRGCQADRLLDFLRDYESENLFLVGDIIDFWAMNRSASTGPQRRTPWCRRSCAEPATASM
jgi:UDP-2,3-diacylglucosamine pyrophosphatase LpxH